MATLTEPPATRFQRRVAFDNIPIGEATKHNIPGLSLCTKHNGFQARRTSRTFMVGVDENNYSDYALQWLLDELVDDGDEIICVRVIEREIRAQDKQYQADAQALMRNIEEKTGDNRAISITLEFTTGKLHDSFQRLIHIYKPAMLIVGTRGRSLGGIQGLVNTRNSFSKYCLQYSPVPVIIVRPTEKRIKKKTKRANDATRRTYVAMLAASDGVHEADSDGRVNYQLESNITAEEEAHQVAKELGLPASFDPTIKPLQYTPPTKVRPQERRALTPSSTQTGADSDSESEDEDGGFEAVSGQEALQNQQNVERQQKLEALHKMEVGEAAALRMPVNDDSDDDDDEDDHANAQAQAQAGAGVS
ncbi:hypothetical protein S7711_03340 [Stachybotrys chartarum IBT 7711]|uniref:UspA domain-containing protein n=1 Tax=Stachybotrys chartarum (strain CBS 109288 / IBT 7711) TaxID=1280523 RepID=A0A084AUR2_STACB|nr:hypothetical protein S7711_03340 [Stachybotrys chartarum IBT 7711]KFA52873.1 hypothetical protein S40293_00883 [Stachybotrys chartarum IBT 40293]